MQPPTSQADLETCPEGSHRSRRAGQRRGNRTGAGGAAARLGAVFAVTCALGCGDRGGRAERSEGVASNATSGNGGAIAEAPDAARRLAAIREEFRVRTSSLHTRARLGVPTPVG